MSLLLILNECGLDSISLPSDDGAVARRGLPAGTVTFLFTDVEGSTRLLHELGAEAYADALAEHRRVVREACGRRGGVEVDTQGDAFFVAFPTAPGAVEAAAEITESLAPGPIHVRMGLHTGTPLVTREGYVGADVHRAARIAAAGHGGQVLVSAATAALLANGALRDLGEHRFKDLAAAERVYQLGEGDFPALKSLYRTNLPVPATPFLGREREVAAVVELVGRPDVRLLTLSGPGGTGKTRLAVQAAAEAAEFFPDGVWWVPLALLRDPAVVPSALAQALDVKEQPERPLSDTVADVLAANRALLLLDNAEHLLPEVAKDIARLRDVDGPTIVVTSRERLQVQGEHVWAVPSLAADDSVALFAARASALQPAFAPSASVQELCERLDNLPLALELAAARTVVFSPEQLLERLGQRLDLLKGGRDADPRQQTLRATIEWSYQLLDDRERQLFRRLSVFAGGCTYEAAEQVADADPDTLQSLIDKSLIRRRDTEVGARYWMLETVREFAAEQVTSAEEDELLVRLSRHVAALVEEAEPHLRQGAEQKLWADRVEADYPNVRTAMEFALRRAPALALEILGSLPFFLWLRGGFAEARGWLDDALENPPAEPTARRARALECAAVVAERQGRYVDGMRFADEASVAYQAVGDLDGVVSAIRERAKSASGMDDRTLARSSYEEIVRLAEQTGDVWNHAVALNNLGDLALYDRDWERAVELCLRSRQLRLELGNRWGAALALLNVATGQLMQGLLREASDSIRTALRESHETGATSVVLGGIELAAIVAAEQEKWEAAALLLGASERLREELGFPEERFERELRAAAEETVRAALTPELYDVAVARGRAMSLDDSVSSAGKTLGDGSSSVSGS